MSTSGSAKLAHDLLESVIFRLFSHCLEPCEQIVKCVIFAVGALLVETPCPLDNGR